MELITFIASLLYLQPSLLFTYAPTQIVLLSLFARMYKRHSWGRSIWLALSSQLISFIFIIVMGILFTPWLNVSLLQFFQITQTHIVMLMAGNFLIHVLCIEFFLRYVLKERGLLGYVLASNAIAAVSVLGLYHMLWR